MKKSGTLVLVVLVCFSTAIQAAMIDVAAGIRRLGSSDAVERATAACVLRQAGAQAAPAVPALAALLGDATPVGRIDCTRGGSARLGTGLHDGSTPGEQAAVALAGIGGEGVTTLIHHLRDPRVQARRHAAFGLGLTQDTRSVEPLMDAVEDAAPEVREQAAWALGLRGDSRAVEPLIATLSDREERVRAQAAWALGLKGDDRAVEPLGAALKDQSAKVRSQAAWALGLKGNGSSVPALADALQDDDAQVRGQAAWALGLRGDRRAVQPLLAAAEDPDTEVRRQARWSLGMLGAGERKRVDVKVAPVY